MFSAGNCREPVAYSPQSSLATRCPRARNTDGPADWTEPNPIMTTDNLEAAPRKTKRDKVMSRAEVAAFLGMSVGAVDATAGPAGAAPIQEGGPEGPVSGAAKSKRGSRTAAAAAPPPKRRGGPATNQANPIPHLTVATVPLSYLTARAGPAPAAPSSSRTGNARASRPSRIRTLPTGHVSRCSRRKRLR